MTMPFSNVFNKKKHFLKVKKAHRE